MHSQGGSIQPDSSASRYVPELDSIRTLAILSVLVFHFLPPDSFFNRLQGNHARGVQLFFTLSGFLITGILTRMRGSIEANSTTVGLSLRTFYIRRFLRIFPIYYATLLIGVLFRYRDLRAALPWHLLYASNFYYWHRGSFDKGPAPVFWTLSVEEQFYLIWPLIFLLLPVRWLARVTVAIVLFGAVYAGWAASRASMVAMLLPAHLVYLAAGSVLGLAGVAPLGSPRILKQAMRGFIAATLAAVVLAIAVHFLLPAIMVQFDAEYACRYLATALFYAWVIARFSQSFGGFAGRFLRSPMVTYLGKISYGIYILQFFVTQKLDRAVPWASKHLGENTARILFQSFPSRMAAIVVIASLSYYFFERPINNLKRFFPYARPMVREKSATEYVTFPTNFAGPSLANVQFPTLNVQSSKQESPADSVRQT